jgi:hypothetical protein
MLFTGVLKSKMRSFNENHFSTEGKAAAIKCGELILDDPLLQYTAFEKESLRRLHARIGKNAA